MKLRTRTEMAAYLGLRLDTFSQLVKLGYLPEPDGVIGKREFWSGEQAYRAKNSLEAQRAKKSKSEKYLSIAAMAEELKIAPISLSRAIARGDCVAPTYRNGTRLQYSVFDIPAVRQSYKARNQGANFVVEGFLNIAQACKLLDMPKQTLDYWIKKGWIKKPDVDLNKQYPYWDEAYLEVIREFKLRRSA